MKIYNYDQNGYLLGTSLLDDSDKCPITGDWLIPAGATTEEPLTEKEDYNVKFNGSEWEYEKILTEDDKKVLGEIPLEEGEKIVDSTLVKVNKPSEYYDWDFTNFIWILNTEREKLAIEQKEINEANKLIEFFETLSKLGLM